MLLHTSGDLLSSPGLHPNLSDAAAEYLSSLGGVAHDELFFHTAAILQAPAYRAENQGALRQDWPRIPLPRAATPLRASAVLGREIARLLDVFQVVKGVNAAPLRKDLQCIAIITRGDKAVVNPDEGDLDLTAGWGHAGKGGTTMPGKGKVFQRPYSPEEEKALGDSVAILGETTFDVFLNDRVYWRNVPTKLWEYTISGYAVIKKWLSYREKELLGRSLTVEEARYVTEMARRLAALMLLGPELSTNYHAITGSCRKKL
jgi:hypothetical protein